MLGHDQDHAVAHHRGTHRERDARVAAGRLDQRIAGLDVSAFLRPPDHRQRGPILDRSRRIVSFELGEEHVRRLTRQALQPHERRVADEIFECYRIEHVSSH